MCIRDSIIGTSHAEDELLVSASKNPDEPHLIRYMSGDIVHHEPNPIFLQCVVSKLGSQVGAIASR